MFKRYELHNHTTQSDAGITCRELIDLMVKDRADAFAITDHNTISGHPIIRRLLAESGAPIQCVYGMEYTTYYGHILCLNLNQYVPWDSINRHHPELLFEACKRAGALTGVAHPFSYGDPFARGCRFEMDITDFSHVDFIEVFNNPEPLHEVNEKGLAWWESLTLKGERLAVTAGMDLHGAWDMSMHFATYAEGEPGGDAARELARAIGGRRTWISKGMLLNWTIGEDSVRFERVDVRKPGFIPSEKYLMTLTGADGVRTFDITSGALELPLSDLGAIEIPKLYGGETAIENLICVAPVIRR